MLFPRLFCLYMTSTFQAFKVPNGGLPKGVLIAVRQPWLTKPEWANPLPRPSGAQPATNGGSYTPHDCWDTVRARFGRGTQWLCHFSFFCTYIPFLACPLRWLHVIRHPNPSPPPCTIISITQGPAFPCGLLVFSVTPIKWNGLVTLHNTCPMNSQ